MSLDTQKYSGPHAGLTYQIIGCAMEVLNTLGHGLHEKPYENSLVIEFALQNLRVDQQRRFEVFYKGCAVGEFVPDMIVNDAVIVDAKVIERITDIERGQMLNYLRIARLSVGLIVNFKRPTLEWERMVL